MEEKERFELFGEHCIKDNNPDARPQLLDAYVACVILNEQDKHIKDLEAKLAESEKNYKDARELGIEQFHSLKEIINSSQEEVDKLKQQLDEKEKELSEYVKIVDDLHKQLSDKCDFCDKTKDQDKILFAVEQLEKVKNYMITDEKDMFGANYLMNSVYVLEFIDNQIKQLKEGK